MKLKGEFFLFKWTFWNNWRIDGLNGLTDSRPSPSQIWRKQLKKAPSRAGLGVFKSVSSRWVWFGAVMLRWPSSQNKMFQFFETSFAIWIFFLSSDCVFSLCLNANTTATLRRYLSLISDILLLYYSIIKSL